MAVDDCRVHNGLFIRHFCARRLSASKLPYDADLPITLALLPSNQTTSTYVRPRSALALPATLHPHVLNQRAAARFAFNCIRSAAPRPPPLRRPTRRRSPMSTFETSTNQRTSTTTYNHNDGPFRRCSNICLQHPSNHPSPENRLTATTPPTFPLLLLLLHSK